jgi:hypothetical protein
MSVAKPRTAPISQSQRKPKKHIVMTLIERGGEARSFHVKNATAKTLRETAVNVASRKSYLATDENPAYTKLGKEFDGHGTVNHSANEYVRLGGFDHVNSAENYFSIFKRGVTGTFQRSLPNPGPAHAIRGGL